MSDVTLMQGDCLDKLKEIDDNSVDSIVTDPPYGLSFMGKAWDKAVPSVEVWEECLRVLKPGGHLLSFAGTRTQHRMAVNIEDAGFEIRDMIAWVFSTGFPKSQNVSKAIDKAAGAERKVVGKREHPTLKDPNKTNEQAGASHGRNQWSREWNITDSATDAAKQWDGWGTALKPALEPIAVARKPLTGTVAANVMEHGTGAINIDGCRVGTEKVTSNKGLGQNARLNDDGWKGVGQRPEPTVNTGRFPANLIHDGSDEVVELFPETRSGKDRNPAKTSSSGFTGHGIRSEEVNYGDSGSAARFFYCPKASKKDRNEGLENTTPQSGTGGKGNGLQRVCSKCGISQRGSDECPDEQNCPKEWVNPPKKNNHPTVKPTELMKYLCRLVTPPGGTVLDPFMGSGSTGKAARQEGFDFIGIELDSEYVEIARARIGSDNLSNFFDFE